MNDGNWSEKQVEELIRGFVEALARETQDTSPKSMTEGDCE